LQRAGDGEVGRLRAAGHVYRARRVNGDPVGSLVLI
jgi:hypothetical protein